MVRREFFDAIEGGSLALDLVTMPSRVLVHANGWGPSFQCDARRSIVASS